MNNTLIALPLILSAATAQAFQPIYTFPTYNQPQVINQPAYVPPPSFVAPSNARIERETEVNRFNYQLNQIHEDLSRSNRRGIFGN